jgi:tRNA U34 2-thiouridine synthase MnmA/TrmU
LTLLKSIIFFLLTSHCKCSQNDRLFSPGLIAEDWHWIAGAPPKKLVQRLSTATTTPTATNGQDEQDDEYPFTAQIRHRQVPQPCTIEPISEAEAEQSATGTAAVTMAMTAAAAVEDISSARLFRVRFKDHQRAIAPGQVKEE